MIIPIIILFGFIFIEIIKELNSIKPTQNSQPTSSYESNIDRSCTEINSISEVETTDLGCIAMIELESEMENLKSEIETLNDEKYELEERIKELESSNNDLKEQNQAMIDFMWDEFEYEWE